MSVIASFLSTKEAFQYIQKVRLYKLPQQESVPPSRFEYAGTTRLLRLITKFIVKSHGLLGVFLESFSISPDSLDKLGTSISKTKSSEAIFIHRRLNVILFYRAAMAKLTKLPHRRFRAQHLRSPPQGRVSSSAFTGILWVDFNFQCASR